VLPERAVLVRDGRIAEIGTTLTSAADVAVIDGTGQTLLPGLIDSHIHAGGGATALTKALVFGVTTALDMFTPTPELIRQFKQEQAHGAPNRADLLSALICVTAPGGHGTQYAVKIPTIAAPEEAQAFVDARIAEGSDYIKIIYGPSMLSLTQEVNTRQTLAAVIRAAHARDKLAVVHVHQQERAREAIELGADGLVHIFSDAPPEAGFGEFVAARKAFVVPTLTVLHGLTGTPGGVPLTVDTRLVPFLAQADIDNLTRGGQARPPLLYAHAEAAVRALSAAGVPILAGTDAPNAGTAQGVSIHRELELLVRAGLTPIAALAAATSEPAKQFRLGDRGRIARGLRADLLLVRGDPTTDITATRDIVAVWKSGVAFDRQAHRAALQPAGNRE
jgi:imidazolonepropionase-like amidohydrolase